MEFGSHTVTSFNECGYHTLVGLNLGKEETIWRPRQFLYLTYDIKQNIRVDYDLLTHALG